MKTKSNMDLTEPVGCACLKREVSIHPKARKQNRTT